ncbi:MAG: SAM-dependent methyltransferase [Opitutus sp.]|nr:SAM-dependent methyltransferase [Opitutus sp.]
MSSAPTDRDYVLGTHDGEINRLGLQHRVWRPTMLAAWQRAGLTTGAHFLDVGAGPGFATLDAAEITGPTGRVIAVERSARFVASARERTREHAQVSVHEVDLMQDEIPAQEIDVAWCRWVASFVASPAQLVQRIAAALRPGGRVVFHEYIDYASWRYLPARPRAAEFVREVMASWRAAGGEPDVADRLPPLLAEHGCRIVHAQPQVFCARPADFTWQWPAAFIEVNLDRLVELKRADAAWAQAVREELRAAESDPTSLVVTPMVLELIAEKRG